MGTLRGQSPCLEEGSMHDPNCLENYIKRNQQGRLFYILSWRRQEVSIF
jgi:hypothetical protein